jgi:hypothetical protein
METGPSGAHAQRHASGNDDTGGLRAAADVPATPTVTYAFFFFFFLVRRAR